MHVPLAKQHAATCTTLRCPFLRQLYIITPPLPLCLHPVCLVVLQLFKHVQSVKWAEDVAEINEDSGKRKSKSESSCVPLANYKHTTAARVSSSIDTGSALGTHQAVAGLSETNSSWAAIVIPVWTCLNPLWFAPAAAPSLPPPPPPLRCRVLYIPPAAAVW